MVKEPPPECPHSKQRANVTTAQESCPVDHKEQTAGCPVDHGEASGGATYEGNIFTRIHKAIYGDTTEFGTLSRRAPTSTPSDVRNPSTNDIVFGQTKQPDQKSPLSTQRIISTIPKSDFTPAHQPSNIPQWVYPSEQQYFNAMKRKGYSPEERDVPVILTIHNIVNEQGWSKVKAWEAACGCEEPKLKKFMGRPKDLSPKAFFYGLIGYSLPFDRHDWVVESCNGEERRYVIDFYKGSNRTGVPLSMYLDVRPALDSPSSVFMRLKLFAIELVGGKKQP